MREIVGRRHRTNASKQRVYHVQYHDNNLYVFTVGSTVYDDKHDNIIVIIENRESKPNDIFTISIIREILSLRSSGGPRQRNTIAFCQRNGNNIIIIVRQNATGVNARRRHRAIRVTRLTRCVDVVPLTADDGAASAARVHPPPPPMRFVRRAEQKRGVVFSLRSLAARRHGRTSVIAAASAFRRSPRKSPRQPRGHGVHYFIVYVT